MKALDEEVAFARQKYRESLQHAVEVLHRVRDEMLEYAQLFCHDLIIIRNQLDPLAYAFHKDAGSGPGSEKSGIDV